MCADADVEEAARAVVLGRLARGNGQICCAVKRVYVQAGVHDAFVDALVAQTAKLTVGDQLLESTDVGPAHRRGGRGTGRRTPSARSSRTAPGSSPAGSARGRSWTRRSSSTCPPPAPPSRRRSSVRWRPVARFDDPQEAVRLANASPYGLHAAVFTRDISRALSHRPAPRRRRSVINGSTALRAENLPFGGTKDTGGYREGMHETVLDFTRQKTVVVMDAFG